MGARKAAGKLTPETVTVDRIEQSVGYVPTNIRLVCFAANNARYIWDDAKLIEMCRAIIAKADQ